MVGVAAWGWVAQTTDYRNKLGEKALVHCGPHEPDRNLKPAAPS